MYFNRHITAGEFAALADFLHAEGELLDFARGACFSQPGGCRRFGVVERGAFRYLLAGRDGREHVVGYAFAGEFVGDYVSLRGGAAVAVRIEALSESCVRTVSAGRLEAFFSADAAREHLGRRLAERLAGEVYERLMERYALTPGERYAALTARCPGLLDLVPLHEVASLLGVRPETLSRIRRRIR